MNDFFRNCIPCLAQSHHGRTWLIIQSNLGLAQNTLDAYARALEDYLTFSQGRNDSLATANKEHIALYVHDLTSRKNPRGGNIRTLDSGAGLANATLQQRLTAVRLFYDYLMEEGLRQDNPVGRGRYTPGKGFAGHRDRGSFPDTASCLGSEMSSSGSASLRRCTNSPFGIALCSPSAMMLRYDEKSCAAYKRETSIPHKGSFISVLKLLRRLPQIN